MRHVAPEGAIWTRAHARAPLIQLPQAPDHHSCSLSARSCSLCAGRS